MIGSQRLGRVEEAIRRGWPVSLEAIVRGGAGECVSTRNGLYLVRVGSPGRPEHFLLNQAEYLNWCAARVRFGSD